MDIDEIDFAILHVLAHADEPLWKRRVTRLLNKKHGDYALVDTTVSPQTVGRRVDTLEQQAYVTSFLTRDTTAPREVIRGYELTEKGEELFENMTDQVLRQYAVKFVEGVLLDDGTIVAGKERRMLLEVLCAKFNLECDTVLSFQESMDDKTFYRTLAASLAIYYMKAHIPDDVRDNPLILKLCDESKHFAEGYAHSVMSKENEEQIRAQWNF